MRASFRTLTGCAAALALLLAACEMPRHAEDTRSKGIAAPAGATLDPATTETSDVEGKGLKVWWRASVAHVGAGEGLSSIYSTDSLLVAETPSGDLYYFNATTGVWTGATRLKGALLVPPLEHNRKLYAITTRALSEIDADSGDILNSLPTRVPVASKPVPFFRHLMLGGGNGRLVCFSTDDGTHEWSIATHGAIHTSPVLDDDVVYAAGYGGKVVAAALRTGERQASWEPREPSKIASGLALKDGFLYVGDNRGFVYSLVARDLVVKGRYPTGGPITGSPIFVGDNLLVFTYAGGALCLTPGTEATLLWSHPDSERLVATGPSNVYLLTRDRSVACVDRRTGEEKWRLGLAEGAVIASEPTQPIFYVAVPGGAIMAVRELEQ